MNDFIIGLLQRPENLAALVLLFFIVKRQQDQIDKTIDVLANVIDRISVAYGEQLQTERLKDYASKYGDTGNDTRRIK